MDLRDGGADGHGHVHNRPQLEISRPEKSRPPTCTPLVLARVSRLSMSDTFQSVMPVAMLKMVAEMPAMTTPATVPPVATRVFRVGPPMRYMVTRVVITQMNTLTQKGDRPRYTRAGRRRGCRRR